MANPQHDIGYEDVSYPEARALDRGVDQSPMIKALLAVLKRPWLTIVTFFVVMVPVMFYLYSQIPLYQSTAVVSVNTNIGGRMLGDYGFNYRLGETGASELFYTSILESYSLTEEIVQRLLEEMPHLPQDSLARLVRRNVSHSTKRNAIGFLYVHAVSEDAKFAHKLAELAVEAFRSISIRAKRSDAQLVVEFTETQLEKLSDNLTEIESKLQSFISDRNLTVNAEATGIDSELRTLQQNLTVAQTRRDMARLQIDAYASQIEARLNAYQSGEQNGKNQRTLALRKRLAELNAALADTASALRDDMQYHDLYLERKQVLADLIQDVHSRPNASESKSAQTQISLKTLETELEKWLLQHENAQVEYLYYKTAIDRFLADHPNLPSDILEFINISRAKDVMRKTIDILVEQRETTRIQIGAESGGIKVIDSPRVPQSPIPMKRSRNIIMAVIVALGLGIGLAYGVDYFDNTVQGESDLTNRFNLPVFGSVPVLDVRGFRSRRSRHRSPRPEDNGQVNVTQLLFHSESSPVAEAYRSIKTSLQFAARDRNQKAFVISSAVAAEGKTLTSYNLGISLAQGGTKTLIIDADLRRASQHKLSSVERQPGLTDLLHDKATLEEVTRSDVYPGLSLIPAGMRVNNPADLLSSKKLTEFIDLVSKQYDIILIDSPPITPCMDSRHLANIVGGMVLIVRAEMTKLNVLEHCLNLCKRVNVDIQGVIINHANFRYGYGYYYVYQRNNPYGYYYRGYNYYYYYSQDQETGEQVKKKRGRKSPSREKSEST